MDRWKLKQKHLGDVGRRHTPRFPTIDSHPVCILLSQISRIVSGPSCLVPGRRMASVLWFTSEPLLPAAGESDLKPSLR